jgi:hypothetical protein
MLVTSLTSLGRQTSPHLNTPHRAILYYILRLLIVHIVLQHEDHDERHLNAFGPSVSMLKGDTVGIFSSTRVNSWDERIQYL